MGLRVIEDKKLLKCTGGTMRVARGQTFRAIADEGKQVIDLTFLNAHNFREHFAAEHSAFLNGLEGTGGYYRILHLYSNPPYENLMATVTSDIVGDGGRGGERGGHFIDDGHCSGRLLEFMDSPTTGPAATISRTRTRR